LPEVIRRPKAPQLFPAEQWEPKRKQAKKSPNGSSLIQEMRVKLEKGVIQTHHDVPNKMPENELSLEEYEKKIKD